MIGKETINDDKFLSIIGAVSALTNGIFKFFFAVSLDYISFKRCFGTLSIIYLLCIIFMKTAAESRTGFLIVTVMSFSLDGAISSMMPVLVFKIYGAVNGPRVYSYIYSVYFIGTFSFVATMWFINDDDNYDILIYVSIVLVTLSFILTISLDEKPFVLK